MRGMCLSTAAFLARKTIIWPIQKELSHSCRKVLLFSEVEEESVGVFDFVGHALEEGDGFSPVHQAMVVSERQVPAIGKQERDVGSTQRRASQQPPYNCITSITVYHPISLGTHAIGELEKRQDS